MADDQVSGSSAADGEASGGRVGAWTDAERYGLLLRIVKNALPEGKGPDWKTLTMPGRTTKALKHQWGQISAQLRDLDLTASGDAAVVSKARAASKKSAKKATAAGDDDGEAEGEADEAAETPNKTPRKRAAATKADGTPKKRRTPAKKTPAKVETDDEENEEMVNAEEKGDEQ
ncbi:hypothetical protein Cob_v000799 [Colletotrichum orbiculare MAFF 240422]|uniref:Myb-like domain-containing protein n=2 Tax=Colletotrichum orbiculare species complex TaxID=2707354 RepID=N4VE27_COLOR|nr:hypothetical protein Cob_v000799 [Colletotrichum orbiculare MAFF 240422]TDZ35323.1 hypothetical protein C8035_v008879 [Colletotrichum spinosum]